MQDALIRGMENGCRSGLYFGFALEDVCVTVTEADFDSSVSEVALSACVADAVREASRAASPVLLEPIMAVDLT